MVNKMLTDEGMKDVDEYDSLPTVYLSGPIEHHPDNGVEWRERIPEAYPSFDYLNPLDSYSPDDVHKENVTARDIVENDKRMILDSDALLVQWPEGIEKCGTPMEILYAFNQGLEVAVWYIGSEPYEKWLQYHSHIITSNLEDCLNYLEVTLK